MLVDYEEQERKNDEFVTCCGWCVGLVVVGVAIVAVGAWFVEMAMKV